MDGYTEYKILAGTDICITSIRDKTVERVDPKHAREGKHTKSETHMTFG